MEFKSLHALGRANSPRRSAVTAPPAGDPHAPLERRGGKLARLQHRASWPPTELRRWARYRISIFAMGSPTSQCSKDLHSVTVITEYRSPPERVDASLSRRRISKAKMRGQIV